MGRVLLLSAIVLLGMAATKATAVLAQSLNSGIIRIVVPAASTTPPDIVSRIIANELSNREGWRVIVENRPGAGGIVEIGQDSAAPDFGRPHANLAKKAE